MSAIPGPSADPDGSGSSHAVGALLDISQKHANSQREGDTSREVSAVLNEDLSHNSVLIIDGSASRFQELRQILKTVCLTKTYYAPGALEASDLYTTLQPDLVIISPDGLAVDAIEAISVVQFSQPAPRRAPVLFIAPDLDSIETLIPSVSSFTETAVDFIASNSCEGHLLQRVRNLLKVRELMTRLQRQQDWLEQAVIARTNSLLRARREVLERLALAAQVRDDDSGEHTQRVGYLAARTAQALNLDPLFVEAIGSAALLHDIGKIGIPDAILHKPGPLTADEFEVVKQHPKLGADILEGCAEPILQMAREIAFTHHERYDGMGYPSRLAKSEIPLAGRIVAVCDVYDAMTRDRVYRPAMSKEIAIQMIVDGSGTAFDPTVVDAFLSFARSLEG